MEFTILLVAEMIIVFSLNLTVGMQYELRCQFHARTINCVEAARSIIYTYI